MEATKNYEQLLAFHRERDSIPYPDLLKTSEWIIKRTEILSRDGYRCCQCELTETIYENRPPYHFYLDGEDDYEPIEDESGLIVGVRRNLRLVPAPRVVVFHIHHKYYIYDNNPWEYPNEALITLCSYCHFELHKTTNIQWFNADNNFRILTPCSRCNGAGWLPEYSHVQGGKCFQCNGARYNEFMK